MDFMKSRIPQSESAVVIKKGVCPDGTELRLERRLGERKKNVTLVANPISHVNMVNLGEPKQGERFCARFFFENPIEAKLAFERLTSGQAKLLEYVDVMEQPRYAICL